MNLRNILVTLTVAVTTSTVTACALRQPADVLGYTECTSRGPRAWVNVRVIDTDDMMPIVAHERKHMEQMRRFESCAAFKTYSRTHQRELESEEFCAAAAAHPRGLDFGINKYAHWLANAYPALELSYDEARVLIGIYCGAAL